MKQDKVLQVCYEDQTVGTLAMTADHKVAFQYSDEWLETGFSINPFSLPLQKQVFVPVKDHFEGLFGVFADSLPDHWGRLLLDRLLRAHKQNPDELTVLVQHQETDEQRRAHHRQRHRNDERSDKTDHRVIPFSRRMSATCHECEPKEPFTRTTAPSFAN